MSAAQQALKGLSVAEAMETRFTPISIDATLNAAVDALLSTAQQEFPVVDAFKRPVGLLTREDILAAVRGHGGDEPSKRLHALGRRQRPTVRRLFIIDGAKALSKAIRRTFGRDAAIRRCQIHKARNILERLPNRCTLRCGASCGKPGKWTTPKRPKRSFAISPAVSNRTGTAFPLRSWKGSTRCSLSRGSASSRTAPLARLRQHHRECHGHGAQGLPQRQILALAFDGPPTGSRRHAGSNQGLPSIEGIQASAGSLRCSCKARPTAAFRRGDCSNPRGCVNFNAQRPLQEFQQTAGHPLFGAPGPRLLLRRQHSRPALRGQIPAQPHGKPTRTNRTGALTPRNIAVSSSRVRSASAASVSASFATASDTITSPPRH